MGIMYSVQEDNLTTDFGISPLFPNTIEDGTKLFNGTAVIAGQCLENTTAGLVLANASSTVYGLAKESVNVEANVNEVSDNGWGIFGSKKITACMFGVYSVKNFEYTKTLSYEKDPSPRHAARRTDQLMHQPAHRFACGWPQLPRCHHLAP